MSAGSITHLVEILLPTVTGQGEAVSHACFENILNELTGKFGGPTSFVRAPGKGLWQSGGGVERDNIAVIEVMTGELDLEFWAALRKRLERELAQDEIVIRTQETRRL
jgi:hypothetical protein